MCSHKGKQGWQSSVKNYAFQMFLHNLCCNLRNLLRNFMYFLFLSNQIANLKSYAVNYAVTA